jgi:hypothetical protein
MISDIALIITSIGTIFAVIISIFSWRSNIKEKQREIEHKIQHDRLSVKPICAIVFENRKNLIAVYILNDGIGPLMIKRVSISDKDGKIAYIVNGKIEFLHNNDKEASNTNEKRLAKLFEFIPDTIGHKWILKFRGELTDRAIRIGGKIILLQLDPINKSIDAKVRSMIKDLTVTVEYTDIYNTDFLPKSRQLSFLNESPYDRKDESNRDPLEAERHDFNDLG